MTKKYAYSNILEEVFKKVKDRETGVLYACIKELAPNDVDNISQRFNIGDRASLRDDLKLLWQTPPFQPVLEIMDSLSTIKRIPPLKVFIEMATTTTTGVIGFMNRDFFIGAILFISLVFLGYWSVIGRKEKEINRNSKKRRNQNKALESESHPVSLCLVVPCNRITPSLQKCIPSRSLSSNETATLIDESVYFLATTEETFSLAIQGDDSWKGFPEGSDLFVQLHIPDGDEILTADLKWSLSQAVSAKEQLIKIKKIGLRKDFSNLEKFHRA